MTYNKPYDGPVSIGALWVKTSKKGAQYMSGMLEVDGRKMNIVCFANKKTKDNQPDYRIMPSEDRPPRQQQEQEYNQAALSSAENNGNDIRVEDIPF